MRYSFLLIIIVLIQFNVHAQKDTIVFNSFIVRFDNNYMIAESKNNSTIYKKQFNLPYYYTVDADGDGLVELVVVDSVVSDTKTTFYIYIYSGTHEFKLVDSIYSSTYFPCLSYAEEISSIIIETGNPDFEIFNERGESSSLPINVWKMEDEKIILVNDEVYEPFLFENANYVLLLDYYLGSDSAECDEVSTQKGIIASAYANYINAGELSLGENFLNKYYTCPDKLDFKQQILDLIFPKAK